MKGSSKSGSNILFFPISVDGKSLPPIVVGENGCPLSGFSAEEVPLVIVCLMINGRPLPIGVFKLKRKARR